jgi:hypothetical protein
MRRFCVDAELLKARFRAALHQRKKRRSPDIDCFARGVRGKRPHAVRANPSAVRAALKTLIYSYLPGRESAKFADSLPGNALVVSELSAAAMEKIWPNCANV